MAGKLGMGLPSEGRSVWPGRPGSGLGILLQGMRGGGGLPAEPAGPPTHAHALKQNAVLKKGPEEGYAC